MKLQDIIIDNKTLGNTLLLVDIQPVFEYVDGRRTTNIIAHKYIIALTDHNFDKIAVKIMGDKLIDIPDKVTPVDFSDLTLFIYWIRGTYELGAKATGIHVLE